MTREGEGLGMTREGKGLGMTKRCEGIGTIADTNNHPRKSC
jgi:hypothetical protein